jgi:hypothetical protein
VKRLTVAAAPLVRAAALAVLLVVPVVALAQAPAAAAAIRKEKASGVEAQFVGYPWRPDVFQTMESGGTAPEGQRSWAFARLATSSFFAIDGKVIPPGHYVLALTPKTGSLPMTLEVRRGEGREIFADPTTMTPPPPGETVYKAPATFATGAEPVPTLDLTLTGWSDGASLTVRYGDRKLTKDLVRAGP